MTETLRGMAETNPGGSRRPRIGMTVVWRLTTANDGSSTEVTEHTEATVCGGGGQGGCVKSYLKRDCFLCQLFISVTSRVLGKMYIKREREAHRLLQQIDTFQLHLFTAQLTLVNKQQTEANSNRKWMKRRLWTKSWLLRKPLYIYIFIRQKGSRNKWKKHQTHNNKKTKKPLSKRANYSEQCYHIYLRTNSKKNIC